MSSGALAEIARSGSLVIGPRTRLITIREPNGNRTWMSNGLPRPPEGMSRDLYALARCVASEANPKDGAAVWLAIAEATRNEAHRRGQSIHSMLTSRTNKFYRWTKNNFGIQKGRWASTAKDANQKSLTAAKHALFGNTSLAGSAIRWLGPALFRKGFQRGVKLRPIGEVISKWEKEGFYICNPSGVDRDELLLFCHPKYSRKSDAGGPVNDVRGVSAHEGDGLELLALLFKG